MADENEDQEVEEQQPEETQEGGSPLMLDLPEEVAADPTEDLLRGYGDVDELRRYAEDGRNAHEMRREAHRRYEEAAERQRELDRRERELETRSRDFDDLMHQIDRYDDDQDALQDIKRLRRRREAPPRRDRDDELLREIRSMREETDRRIREQELRFLQAEVDRAADSVLDSDRGLSPHQAPHLRQFVRERMIELARQNGRDLNSDNLRDSMRRFYSSAKQDSLRMLREAAKPFSQDGGGVQHPPGRGARAGKPSAKPQKSQQYPGPGMEDREARLKAARDIVSKLPSEDEDLDY